LWSGAWISDDSLGWLAGQNKSDLILLKLLLVYKLNNTKKLVWNKNFVKIFSAPSYRRVMSNLVLSTREYSGVASVMFFHSSFCCWIEYCSVVVMSQHLQIKVTLKNQSNQRENSMLEFWTARTRRQPTLVCTGKMMMYE